MGRYAFGIIGTYVILVVFGWSVAAIGLARWFGS